VRGVAPGGHDPAVARPLRDAVSTAFLYGRTATQVLPRGLGGERGRPDVEGERVVFVLGAPRSGTTWMAESLGSLPGFVDLGEVRPLKVAIPGLAALDEGEAARRVRETLDRVRRLSFVRGLRAVEQTPETSFVLGAATRAYPQAAVLHLVRDGRDVVCSLLERGWLSVAREGRDDARLAYGAHARFWVEPERREEFARASDATRAAWAWRRYLTAARAAPARTLEVRYEELATDFELVAERIAGHVGVDPERLAGALSGARSGSIGRWRRELTAEQLADVEREAGALLGELGYV
jgi:hypothetical protein